MSSEAFAVGSRGKWSQRGVPHKGWSCVDVEDLGEPSETCEMCEVQEIRYVHVMTHPEYPASVRAGCVCAGHMEGDLEAAKTRERVRRNASARRSRWLERAWRVSRSGNPYLNTDGYNIVVYSEGTNRWRARITHRQTGAARTSRLAYGTADGAKLAAFDGLIWLKEKERPSPR